MWVSVWFPESLRGVVYIPPKCFNQKMNKNDRSWKKVQNKNMPSLFSKNLEGTLKISPFCSRYLLDGAHRHSAATRIFWSLQPLKPSKDTSQLCRWWKNHRDPIRLRRNFLKVKKMTTPNFRVFEKCGEKKHGLMRVQVGWACWGV